jgi:hypothetical protein
MYFDPLALFLSDLDFALRKREREGNTYFQAVVTERNRERER